MPISIQLSSETEQRLDFLATQTGRSKADYLREIIENGIEDREDYYLAMQVLERVRNGQEKVYSASDVRKELGLDD
jgi:RHH-type rel operon transcriptional repressor/antitoxin RelB